MTFLRLGVFLDIPLETVSMITGYKPDAIKAYYDIPDSNKQIETQKFNNLKIS